MFTITAKLTLDFLDLTLAGPTERTGSPITLPFDGSGLHKAVIINVPVRRPHSAITTVPPNTSPFLQAGDCTLITLCKSSYCSLAIYTQVPSCAGVSMFLEWRVHYWILKERWLPARRTLVDIVGTGSGVDPCKTLITKSTSKQNDWLMHEHLDTHANTQPTCCVTSTSDMSMTDNVPSTPPQAGIKTNRP